MRITKKRKSIQFPETTKGKVLQFPVRNEIIEFNGDYEVVPVCIAPKSRYLLYIKPTKMFINARFCECELNAEFVKFNFEGGQEFYQKSDIEIRGKLIPRGGE